MVYNRGRKIKNNERNAIMAEHKGYVISCFWGNWYVMGKEFETLDECKEYVDNREGA